MNTQALDGYLRQGGAKVPAAGRRGTGATACFDLFRRARYGSVAAASPVLSLVAPIQQSDVPCCSPFQAASYEESDVDNAEAAWTH
jgi:hypothetical protein